MPGAPAALPTPPHMPPASLGFHPPGAFHPPGNPPGPLQPLKRSGAQRSTPRSSTPPASSRSMGSARGRHASPRNGRATPRASSKDKAKAKKSKKKTGRIISKELPKELQEEPATIAAASRLQRRWRAVLARRAAQADLQQLREWDALVDEIRHESYLRRTLRASLREWHQRAEARAAAVLAIQCAARRRLARRKLRELAATRLQCAARQLFARRLHHDTYWAYAFGLMHEETAQKLQRWWRMLKAKWQARADLELLREWDAFSAQLALVKAQRAAAATKVQLAVRRRAAGKWIAMVLGEEVASLELELDPFSSAYVGPEEHRRRVEANEYGGRLRKRGNISRNAMVRALPSQVATLYNTLRFVDAVNALLVRRLVPTTEAADGGLSTSYVELMAWGDKALQARFAGATQYLKAAKKFGLLHFRGEVLHEGVAERSNAVHSWSLGCKRQALLDLALLKPQRILPAIARAHPRVRDSVVRFLVFESSYAEQTADFLQGSFEQDLGSLRDAAREAARREEASCAEEAGDHASGARKGAARARIAEIDEAFWPDEDDNEKEEETDARAEAESCARCAHSRLAENDTLSAQRLVQRSLRLCETEAGRQMELRVQDRLADEAAVRRVLHALDLFEVLELGRDCPPAAIKKAFIKLSKALHPDKNGAPAANEAFDRLRTAQQTLSDPQQRAAYSSEHPPRGRAAREWAAGVAGKPFRARG